MSTNGRRERERFFAEFILRNSKGSEWSRGSAGFRCAQRGTGGFRNWVQPPTLASRQHEQSWEGFSFPPLRKGGGFRKGAPLCAPAKGIPNSWLTTGARRAVPLRRDGGIPGMRNRNSECLRAFSCVKLEINKVARRFRGRFLQCPQRNSDIFGVL